MLPFIRSLGPYIAKHIYPSPSPEVLRGPYPFHDDARPDGPPDVQISLTGEDTRISVPDSGLDSAIPSALHEYFEGSGLEVDQADTLSDLLKIYLKSDITMSQDMLNTMFDVLSDAI